jgi:hypothetical protein
MPTLYLFRTILSLSLIVLILIGCSSAKTQSGMLPSVSTATQPPQKSAAVPEMRHLDLTEPLLRTTPTLAASDPITESSPKSETPPLDWTMPSGGDYPMLSHGEPVWIDVSINKQRVYIKDGDKILYTMVTSSGLDTSPDNSTPKGTFYIQAEKGPWFYNKAEQEGAKYFVSWKNHGEFLFHSVAMDKNGKVIEEEAKKLGQKASHGCLRLTLPDAKWIYDHIPVKTKVVIRT